MRAALLVVMVALLCPAQISNNLHLAVRAGDIDKTRELLKAGADVNSRDNLGGTPLHSAAWNGNVELATLLLENGAAVDAKHAEGGSTPLIGRANA